MTTFSELLTQLQATDPSLPLIFETRQGAIGAGYHVTELRHSYSKGIDCGGNIQTWQEARLQLMDGYGGEHMSVGKFSAIVDKSLAAVPELKKADLLVEFGHNNSELSLMAIQQTQVTGNGVTLSLGDARAVCKPAQMSINLQNTDDVCCGSESDMRDGSSCCVPSVKSANQSSCCG